MAQWVKGLITETWIAAVLPVRSLAWELPHAVGMLRIHFNTEDEVTCCSGDIMSANLGRA